jgi:hypothetical protein
MAGKISKTFRNQSLSILNDSSLYFGEIKDLKPRKTFLVITNEIYLSKFLFI